MLKFMVRVYYGFAILSVIGGILGLISTNQGGASWYYLFVGIIMAANFATMARLIEIILDIQAQQRMQTKMLRNLLKKLHVQ